MWWCYTGLMAFFYSSSPGSFLFYLSFLGRRGPATGGRRGGSSLFRQRGGGGGGEAKIFFFSSSAFCGGVERKACEPEAVVAEVSLRAVMPLVVCVCVAVDGGSNHYWQEEGSEGAKEKASACS